MFCSKHSYSIPNGAKASSLITTKHICRYLCGTIHHCLRYASIEIQLLGYIDSDWGGSDADGKSTTSGCFSLGSSMFSWMKKNKS